MKERDKPFVATPYIDEEGEIIAHLEDVVTQEGKKHWLETNQVMRTQVTMDEQQSCLFMKNEFVKRLFKVPQVGDYAFYTKSYSNEYTEQELLIEDHCMPEVCLGLYDDGYCSAYEEARILREPEYFYVGGATSLQNEKNTFRYVGYKVESECTAQFEWQSHKVYGNPSAFSWPPKGQRLTCYFSAPVGVKEAYQNIRVEVIYEMYDGIPAMKKCVQVINAGGQTFTVAKLSVEAFDTKEEMKKQLHMETSYTCGTESTIPINTELPCGDHNEPEGSPFARLVGCKHSCYPLGPAYELTAGEKFISFDTYTLLFSTYWFELRGKEIKGMYERLFPWTTDNPLTFHHTGKLTREVIDHTAEIGFEMIIQSFGSWDVSYSKEMLSTEEDILLYYKDLIDYAHSKGVAIGMYQAQYTLSQYRDQGAEYGSNDQGTWGTWCMASEAYADYVKKFLNFLDLTGIDCVEIDGPYPGCACGNGEKHRVTNTGVKVHHGYFDSIVRQWENAVRDLISELRRRQIYVKVPAWYYLSGGNKSAIGYEEVAWSQPRHEQLIYGRQIIHNASYGKKSSQSWSHIPFAVYHGGGDEATYSPFVQKIKDYNWVLAQNIGNGVTSDYRGAYLYEEDGGRSKDVISKWVKFYKKYRAIADADLVAIKQANVAGGLDVLYHANAKNPNEKGLLWVYNQTNEEQTEVITVPMYYTGLTHMTYPSVPIRGSLGKNVKNYGTWPPNYDWIPSEEANYVLPQPNGEDVGKAVFRREEQCDERLEIDSNGHVKLQVTLPPMSFVYYMIYGCENYPPLEEHPILCNVDVDDANTVVEDQHMHEGILLNQCFSFNGISDYVDLGYGQLNGCDSYVVEVAYKTSSDADQVLFSQGQDRRGLGTSGGITGNYEVDDLTLSITEGYLQFVCSDISSQKEVYLRSSNTLLRDQWVSVCIVNEKGYYRLIINGEQVDAQRVDGMVINTRNNLLLGAIKNHAGGSQIRYFSGELKLVKLQCC
ncbi:MAG: hypothetical protein ACRCW2_06655 [Cellulosilyticaceae bacterium]